MSHRRTAIVLGAMSCAVVLGACGDQLYPLAPVRGRVTTCEGKPAAGGWIVFTPLDQPEKTGRPAGQPGRLARAMVAADGTFVLETSGNQTLAGVVIGRHEVSFEMPLTRPAALTPGERALMSPADIKESEQKFAKIPYFRPIACSASVDPHDVEVVAGENVFEFNLQPGKPTSRHEP